MVHRLLLLLLGCCLFATLPAQTDGKAARRVIDDAFSPLRADTLLTDSLAPRRDALPVAGLPSLLSTSRLGAYGFDGFAPFSGGIGATDWRLHEGFNAQLGLSLTVGLGHHAPSGVGFGKEVGFAYAAPLNRRLSVAAGLYGTHFDWGAFRTADVGLAALLAYRLNERITLYAYGAKSVMPAERRFAFGPYGPLYSPCSALWLGDIPKERFGVAAEFKLGENAMIGVSVEHHKY